MSDYRDPLGRHDDNLYSSLGRESDPVEALKTIRAYAAFQLHWDLLQGIARKPFHYELRARSFLKWAAKWHCGTWL